MHRRPAIFISLFLILGLASCNQGGGGKSISVQCEIKDSRPAEANGTKVRAYLVDAKKSAREVASGSKKLKFRYASTSEGGSPTFSMVTGKDGKETLSFSDLGKNMEKLEIRDSADKPLTYVIDDYSVKLPKKDLTVQMTLK